MTMVVADAPALALQARPIGPGRRFWKRFRRNRLAVVALGFLVLVILSAVCAPWFSTHDPMEQDLRGALLPPSGDHWFGTDDLGRDLYSRTLHAGRVSLVAVLQAVGVGLIIGLPLGLIAGYVGGWIDAVIMRAVDTILALPPLILAIAIVGIRGKGLTNAMIAIGIVFAPRFARLLRGTVQSVRAETFIEASRSIGTPAHRIIRSHILPNVFSPLIVQVSLAAAFAMLAEAGLSFLGLGVQPPDASWGYLLFRAFGVQDRAWWFVVFPGLFIALTVLALNLLGDGVRDAIGREERPR
jgi:peptide/nickel transport system permease protein